MLALPFDLTPLAALYLACALLGAAFVRGYTGFGFSAIFVACAALVTNPLPFVPVVLTCEIIMTLFQARGIRGQIDWPRAGWLLAGATLALPFSVAAIVSVGETTVRLLISGLILALSLVLLRGWTLKRTIGGPGHGMVGVLSGICNAAAVGGLPVAGFLSAQPLPPARFRATMIAYLTGLECVTLPMMWAAGLITGDTAIAVALAVPLLLIGVWLGGRQFLAASPATFRQFAVMALLALSSLGLLRALI